jgi:hypothetical protein
MEFNNSTIPQKFSQEDCEKCFSDRQRGVLAGILSSTSFSVGLEHSQYILKSLSLNLPGQDIFEDVGRFHSKMSSKDYFALKGEPKDNYPAASLINLPDSFNEFEISNFKIWDARALVGKIGVVSSLHFDWNPCSILLFNISGSKKIELYSPMRSYQLKSVANFSINNTLVPDFVFVLNSNEAIYIPMFWWHRVTYVTDAQSISFRFPPRPDLWEIFKRTYPSWKAIKILHDDHQNEISQQVISLISNRDDGPIRRFKLLENFYNSIIKPKEEDSLFYRKWCLLRLERFR